MIKKILFILCFTTLVLHALVARERISFNEGWKFKKGDSENLAQPMDYDFLKQWMLTTGNDFLSKEKQYEFPCAYLQGGEYTDLAYNDDSWRSVTLPHDWGIEGPFRQEYEGETGKLPWWGVAWYRKTMDVLASDAGQQFYLDIDGAMSFANVWCNGEYAGGWAYGYTSFRIDLSPFIKAGEKNIISIRLDNPEHSSRWYPGGGIYRNVWLVKANPTSVGQWGTYIVVTPQEDKSADIALSVSIDNHNLSSAPIKVKTEIFALGKNGQPAGKVLVSDVLEDVMLVKKTANKVQHNIRLKNAKRWDVESPNLYVAVTTLLQNGRPVDTYHTNFGVRTLDFQANDGFHLNGRKLHLKGVCMHHDLGALGAAFNYRAMERQLEILREMGVNAIRTSHNPPAPELLDLCDKMGFVVIDEAFDTWKEPKKPNGYAILFDDWHEQDLRALVRRDRNHPCVILWSTGNEIGEQQTENGAAISAMLTSIVRDEDPTRLVTVGCDRPVAAYNGFENSIDVYGFNYKPHLYKEFHEKRPDIPFYGSETASCISTRGEYLFPVSDDKGSGQIGFQMSSYDLYAPYWATPPDWEFKGQDENPASAGEFVWTGFDYLGEPTPFNSDMTILSNYNDPVERAKAEQQLKEIGKIEVPSRSSYFGIVDLAGFKKDRFYIYQARWRPDYPMAHLLPHWNWLERIGEVTPVHVYTSGDEAELFLNGESLGRKTKGKYEYRLRWDDVVYQPGELKVIAYKNGKKWAEDIVRTSGEVMGLKLEADRTEMSADGNDLIYITVRLEDENGLFVPRADNLVKFQVFGPAEIVATDNGDPTSQESFQNHEVKAFNGLCLVIVRSKKGETGNITVAAVGDGILHGDNIKLKSR